MKSNAELTEEYFACAEELDGDIAGRRSAYEYMKNSTAIVHEKVVASSFIPRLYNDESWETLRSIAETTHRILCKVIEHYRERPNIATFSPSMSACANWCFCLAATPTRYPSPASTFS